VSRQFSSAYLGWAHGYSQPGQIAILPSLIPADLVSLLFLGSAADQTVL